MTALSESPDEKNHYDEKPEETPQSKGGNERAKSLSPEERQRIARAGAIARWQKANTPIDPNRTPNAEYNGPLEIGEAKIDAYVLDDGRRVIHKRGMAKALGMKSEGGNAFMKTMNRKGLGSALPQEIRDKIDNPLVFNVLAGDPGHGYEATFLIDLCKAIMRANKDGKLKPSQEFLAIQAEVIVSASAKLGIVALVDEATGYIADKRKEEYRELFRDFIREECRQWEKEFPDQFFEMFYKLYGLKRKNPKANHPSFFGHLIRKYIYHPLANSNGAVLKELDEKNPVVYTGGGRKHKLHQFLSENVGVPAFRAHLWQVVGIGNSVTDKASFDKAFDRAFPKALPPLELFPDYKG